MKQSLQIALVLLATTSVAHADNPPPQPLPPNPFSNLPAGGNPFDDDDDVDFFGDSAPPAKKSMADDSSGFRRGDSGSGVTISAPRPNKGNSAANAAGAAAAGKARPEPANSKDIVENFDYPDAEILDVAKAISKLTGKNFIYNPQDIKGKISIVSETAITVGDAWSAFLTALNMRGIAIVPSGKYLRLERVASAKEKQNTIYDADQPAPHNDEFITRVIPLRYIDAQEFEQAFRLWIPREARMQAYAQTNTLIFTDTASHIQMMTEVVKLLDVAGYQEALSVIQIKNAASKDIARLIEQIIAEGKGGTGNNFGFGSPARPQPTYGAPAKTSKGRNGGSVISKIIADDRTNTIIVKANAAGIAEIKGLVRRLDTKLANNGTSGNIHVIKLRFADAEQLSKTLSSVATGSKSNNNQRSTGFGSPGFGFGNQGGDVSVFKNEIKISADKTTQSLIVSASGSDFVTFKKVVESLDIPRDQVFLQALILEMRLNRDNSFGTSFVTKDGVALPSASGALTKLLSGNPIPSGFVLGFKKGSSQDFTPAGSSASGSGQPAFRVNSLNGLIELIQSNVDANVIATPRITALDNEEAELEISESIMVPTKTTTGTSVSDSFSPDKAALYLKVKPQINKGSKFVKLDIEQKLENFDSSKVPEGLKGSTQGKNSRSTKTKVLVQDEDTVVLSGLIRDEVQEIINKVPLLGDIPILGWLFKNTARTVRKTNLMVFLTPQIIKQYGSIRKVLNSHLEEREEFNKDNGINHDPYQKDLDKMRKKLPSLTVIEPMQRSGELQTESFSIPTGPDTGADSYDGGYDGGASMNMDPMITPPNEIGTFPSDNSPPPVVIPENRVGE